MSSWKDLLKTEEQVVLPWIGGRVLRSADRVWKIEGKLPQEFGWYSFILDSRTAKVNAAAEPNHAALSRKVSGFLLGDRLLEDRIKVAPYAKDIALAADPVALIEPGLDLFVRIQAGRVFEGGPLIFETLDFPCGAEQDVLSGLLDGKTSVDHIPNVPPALDAAFRVEVNRRKEAERIRLEIARKLAEEEAKRVREEQRQQFLKTTGSAEGRRNLAKLDFSAAARAALAVSGATYLDDRKAPQKGERIVRYRYQNRRLECVVNEYTLAIVDSGICLTDHDTGEKGDTWLTLESLPSVIKEAIDSHLLVVYRHG